MTLLIGIAVVTACLCALALTASYVYKMAFQLGIEQHKTSVELALKIQEAKKSAFNSED